MQWPRRIWLWGGILAAVLSVYPNGTHDLPVRLARDKQVGDRLYRAGEVVHTGLDIPRWGLFALGVKVVWDRGHLRAGIACATSGHDLGPASKARLRCRRRLAMCLVRGRRLRPCIEGGS